jgi:2-hydroxychromene-2-carboxylate isomerase
VAWRPILVGALFRAIGTPNVPLTTLPEPKRRYVAQDLADWAAHYGVPFRFPSRFPMRTVAPLRLALAAGERVAAVSRALFSAYWVDDRDLTDGALLATIAAQAGVPSHEVERALEPAPEIRQALIDNTGEAERRGLCGVPSFLVRGHLFWGQDRLDLVERTLAGWEPPTL